MDSNQLRETLGAVLPTVNAGLNSLCALLLFVGAAAIRKKQVDRHRGLMIGALLVSAVFLGCYLVRVALTGTHAFPGMGLAKAVYLFILGTHMVLAAAVPFLALRSIWLAVRGRIPEHRRLVRYTWPIWMYVSVTGVVVYLMLYHWPAG